MDDNVVEEWRVVDRWWTDNPTEREFKVLTDGTTWVRERISDTEWSNWTEWIFH